MYGTLRGALAGRKIVFGTSRWARTCGPRFFCGNKIVELAMKCTGF